MKKLIIVWLLAITAAQILMFRSLIKSDKTLLGLIGGVVKNQGMMIGEINWIGHGGMYAEENPGIGSQLEITQINSL